MTCVLKTDQTMERIQGLLPIAPYPIPTPMQRLSVLFIALVLTSCASTPSAMQHEADQPQNVIFFISDGCGPASFGLAREYQRSMDGIPNLQLDPYEQGSTITFAEGSRVTDSAASATAYACAIKTLNGRIAMTADRQSVETILEKAEKAGYNTGVISTARITHATPAAFSSHVESRNMEAEIAEQQMAKGMEIVMGGGTQFYTPTEQGGARTDGRNLIVEAQDLGYHRVDDRSQLLNADALPLIGLFTRSHMAYEIDRDRDAEPSLAEMTTKALELLSADGKPFFIMIEAGRIDHAGHGNDPAAHLWDVMAYDAAWKVAVDFAALDGETLVLGTSDHETGGLTLGAEYGGNGGSGYAYDPTKLAAVSSSIEAFGNRARAAYADGSFDADWVRQHLESSFNVDMSAHADRFNGILAVADTNAALAVSGMQRLLVDVTSDSARVGWSTGGHTAVNVPIFGYGPGAEHFKGTLDNTEIGARLQEVLGLK